MFVNNTSSSNKRVSESRARPPGQQAAPPFHGVSMARTEEHGCLSGAGVAPTWATERAHGGPERCALQAAGSGPDRQKVVWTEVRAQGQLLSNTEQLTLNRK